MSTMKARMKTLNSESAKRTEYNGRNENYNHKKNRCTASTVSTMSETSMVDNEPP